MSTTVLVAEDEALIDRLVDDSWVSRPGISNQPSFAGGVPLEGGGSWKRRGPGEGAGRGRQGVRGGSKAPGHCRLRGKRVACDAADFSACAPGRPRTLPSHLPDKKKGPVVTDRAVEVLGEDV